MQQNLAKQKSELGHHGGFGGYYHPQQKKIVKRCESLGQLVRTGEKRMCTEINRLKFTKKKTKYYCQSKEHLNQFVLCMSL